MGNWRQFLDSVDGLQRRAHNEITQITEFGPRRRSAVSPSSRSALRQPAKTALSYDPNGNLLDDGEYLYSWDAFNRLVEVRLKRNSRIVGQYFYDAMHRRTRRLANLDHNASLETQATYVYDGFNCISEISNLGSVIKDYVWGNDLTGSPQSAGGVGGLVAVLSFSPHPSASYPLYDVRGNITAYTGSSGSITATFDYLPFGALASSTGNADAFSYRFSTKPFDPETGLVYYSFRYYSPELGRWISRDPIGEKGGLNLYAMVGNNSTGKWDFLGLQGLFPRPPWQIDMDAITREELARIAVEQETGRSNPHKIDVLWSIYNKWEKESWLIESDKYIHCMAACELARSGHWSKDEINLLGDVNELRDNLSAQLFGLLDFVTLGKIPRFHDRLNALETFFDSIGDTFANQTGINCPKEETCECCCGKYSIRCRK